MKFFLSSKEIHIWVSPGNVHFFNEANSFFLGHSLNHEESSSRKVLRFLLARYLDTSPNSLIFQKTDRGKLFLPEHPHLFFNIAHSGDLLTFVFSSTPVGIDLEKKRKVKALALANKFFSLEEINFINSEGETGVEKKFFQLWTAKEAILKGDGRGITEGLREVFALIENKKILSFLLGKDLWHITSLLLEKRTDKASKLAQEYAVAVASLRKDPLIRWYDFSSFVNLDGSCHFKILT